jgi:hypothetical protein
MAFIGALTALIGDLASAFGCTVGLKDSVTAISFVALGTSLPGKQHRIYCDLTRSFLSSHILNKIVYSFILSISD